MAYQDYLQTQDPSLTSIQSGGLPTYGPTAPPQDPLKVTTPYITPQTISSTTITPPVQNLANQVVYPEPQPITTPLPDIKPPELTLSPTEQSIEDLIKQTTEQNTTLAGEQAYRTEQETAQGVPELTKSLNDLRAQQQAILNEQTQIQLNAPQAGQGGVSSVIASSKYGAQLRENAVKALGISSLIAASQGQLGYANSLVDRAVQQKFGTIRAERDAKIQNLELLLRSPSITLAEKKRAQAQLDYQRAQQKQEATQEENEKEIWNIATSVAKNGSAFTSTQQFPTLSVALSAIQNAQSKEYALQIASATGLLSSPTSVTAPKILGNSTTGYFTYDASTGQSTPIAPPVGSTPPVSPGEPTGTTPPEPTTSTYKFTSTQLNTGAASAAMTLDTFKQLPGEVQNFYINSKTLASQFNEAKTAITSGSAKAEDVKANIQSMAIPQTVKEYLLQQIDTVQAPEQQSFLGGVWDNIKNFFGF